MCSAVVMAGVGCSDALEPGGSRGVVFLPLWAVLVGYHSLSAEGVSVRWGSLKGKGVISRFGVCELCRSAVR